ncbi:transportin MOS14 [Ricinus communis]|uniref:transportin MOS14 n=1 Tax=Ricinus communis TaxID=3988 RepID=UPI0007722816|nr:transportin MOS14 [Ricinus communis]|eukprot:XP_015581100.1 transportin MOS14 [Ricinus communis]
MDHQKAVKEALNALYHHPDEVLRSKADEYLQDIQRSIDAWQVADNLLHDSTSNMETLIFCSQTLRSKVQRDYEELPSEAFGPLRTSLTTLLKKFHRGPPKVRTQISIAVAALAVQVPAEDWGDGGIVNWLKDEMNSHPEYIPGFLELLTVLPEEVFNYKIAARPERRRQFEKELTSQMEVALNILTACLKINELKEQVLEAFASWLRLRHGTPGSVLSSHPLVLTALSSLNSELLSEAAVNVISELIHYTTSGNSGGISIQMPLIQVLVPQVMSLKEQLRDPSKDEEDVKAIARLFADMGDSYVELIATGSDEAMMIVNALLEVASHPEYDIASMTFNFWHSLQVILTKRDSYTSFGDETSIKAERSRRLLVFRSAYESLVSLVSFRVQYPQDYQNLSIEDLKDFKHTRYAVADVLIDAASVLNGDATLKILYVKLAEAQACWANGHSEWRPAEAALFCIRAISNYVSIAEAEVLPKVMSLLLELPHQPQLLQTVCLTIGAYSKWLSAASDGLPLLSSVMRILMHGMGTSEDSAAAAAVAFRHICDDCRRKLCGYLDDLYSIYHRALIGEGNFRISAEDSLHVVEALSMVITELPPDQAKQALEQLCLPVVTSLQGVINQGPETLEKRPARELTVHIDRLAYIFRYVTHPEAVADAIQRLWPLFKAIFDLRAWDMRTMESLCRACKYAVRTSGRFMGITIGAMLEEIQALYQQHHQPCFLYLSSEVIKIFGSDPSCACYLTNLIEALFKRTICLLTNIKDFTARPDIADDCFLLASRCIRYCPQLFVTSTVFPLLVDCSMIGITVQHREASNSILTFLSDIFDLAKSSVGEHYLSVRDSVIIPRGASITRILVASLTGALPSSRIETVAYALLAVTRTYGARAVEWAMESISLIPLTAVTEVERARFFQALSDAASGIDVNALMAPVEELSDVCRRNRTVQEIVQGALRPLELNLVTVS